jgi:hypothetical protein
MVDFPGICKKMGWDPSKMCGPWTCALRVDDAEACCPFNHSKGSGLHTKRPQVEGKPFVLGDWIDRFVEQGLITKPEQLKVERAEDKPPPGKPTKTKDGALVYPARHFG